MEKKNYHYANKSLINFFFHNSNYLLLLFFLILGLFIVKDYGLSTDEPFHRTNGYFWYLNLVEKLVGNNEIFQDLKNKFQNMYWSNDFENGLYHEYGIFFDLVSALVEEALNIDTSENAFYLKHKLNFITFFISIIFFYKLINERFKNTIFSTTITIFYLSSPRIFAEAFYNPKDIIFMSFSVIALYYCLNTIEKFSFKNIFYFSLFSSIATNVRIMGILFLFLFSIFFIFNSLEEKNYFKKNLKNYLIFIIFYFFFLYLFWPYLWESPLNNFFTAFKSFANYEWGGSVLYLGKYHLASSLPWHYIAVWIISTTPVFFLFFIFVGLLKTLLQFLKNFLNLSNQTKIWFNIQQQKDFFILFFFFIPLISVVLFNSTLYGGWRHLYFIHPCLVYFIAVAMELIFLKLNIRNFIKNILKVFVSLVIIINCYTLIKLHPYQNIYFNFFMNKYANNFFEIDYWGLGNREAIKFLDANNIDKDLEVRTASFTPLFFSKFFLNPKQENIKITGTENTEQDFIFTNFVYESDPKYLKKYTIPKNYSTYFILKKNNIIINKILQKN